MAIHTIHFLRPIEQASLAYLNDAVQKAIAGGHGFVAATELHVYISSEGGQTDQGFAAYHLLRSVPVPIATYCLSNVESMAVIMFLAGTKRVIVPHGKIKVHPLNWGFREGFVDHDRLAEYVDSLDFDAKRYAEIFEERTAGAAEKLDVRAHLAGRAKILNAQEAVRNGLATEVAECTMPAKAHRWWVP